MELLFDFELEYDEKAPFGLDEAKDLEYLLSEIDKYEPSIDKEFIAKAFKYCCKYHHGVKRKSGYPYYTHPLNVTLILLREFIIKDSETLAACLLHDVIEDVDFVDKEIIAEKFGEEVAEMVYAVTKISHSEFHEEEININLDINNPTNKNLFKAFTYRKLFLALVKDIRVMLIKLADRLHNLRTLHYLKESKQREIAIETLNFYIPIAHRLGLTKIKAELENRSFYFSERSTYEAIKMALKEKRRDFIDYIRMFADTITNSLNSQNIPHILSIVHKHEYEIFRMIQDGTPIEEIDNFYSMVIILESDDVTECYKAHGALANTFKTISFVDYIANPKMDLYRSLNSELFGPDGKRVEILIRTNEMERISEEGFASQFSLKSGRIRALGFQDNDLEDWGEWMQDIIEEKGENATPIIWDSIKFNLFDNELNVFTKEGKTVTLPQGANLIDLAFAISEDTGLKYLTARINGIFQEWNYELVSGDRAEIIVSPNSTPKYEWMKRIVTHKAVVALHKYFKYHKPIINKIDRSLSDIKLLIKGEDRARMLFDITEAIGKSNIKRINLDTTDSVFEGAISLNVKSMNELNKLFVKLLNIKGINSVKKIEE